MAAYVITEPPASEPVSVAEMKLWLKQEQNDDDDLIAGLITAAREMCETFTNRAFVTQTWTMSMDALPGYIDRRSVVAQSVRTLSTGAWELIGNRWGFVLPASPVQSVTSLTYNDQNGNLQTLLPGVSYNADILSSPARIFPVFSTFWPLTQYAPNAVTVTFVCGYGSVKHDGDGNTAWPGPKSIQTAIKMQAAWLYNNRSSYAQGQGLVVENPAVMALLGQYRDLRF